MTLQLAPFSYANLTLDETITDLAVRFVLNCPPEDLSTPVRLMFQLEEANWFYVDYAKAQNDSLPLLRLKSFVAKIYQTVPVIKRICPDHNEALFQFSNYKRGIPVRGGIILNEKLDKVLLVRAWKAKTWGFPRGKINKGEDDLVCAVREVYEETGFDISPYVRRQNYVEKTIEGKNFLLFFATGVPETTEFITRTREEIEEIKWFPLSQIASRASHKFFLVPIFYKDIERFAKRNRQSKFGSRAKNDRNVRSAPASAAANGSDTLKELLGIDSSSGKLTDQEKRVDTHIPRQNIGGPALPTLQTGSQFVSNTYNGMLPLPVVYGTGIMPGSWGGVANSVPTNSAALGLPPIGATSPVSNVANDCLAKPEDQGAKKILALLNHNTVNDSHSPPKQSPEEHILPKESMDDPVHHIDILDQLLSSRRNRKSHHTSTKPTAKPRLKQNSLLQVLNSSRYTKQSKLLDLLKPSDQPSKQKNTTERAENALMKLLGHSVGTTESKNAEPENTKPKNAEPKTTELKTIDPKIMPRIDNPMILKLLSEASLETPFENETTQDSPNAPAVPRLPLGINHLHHEEKLGEPDVVGERQSLLDLLGIKNDAVKPTKHAESTSSGSTSGIGQEIGSEASPTIEKSAAGIFSTVQESQPASMALPKTKNDARPLAKKPNALLSLLGGQ